MNRVTVRKTSSFDMPTRGKNLQKSETSNDHLEGVLHVCESIEHCSALWWPGDGGGSERQRARAARQALLAARTHIINERLKVGMTVLIDRKDATQGTSLPVPSGLRLPAWEPLLCLCRAACVHAAKRTPEQSQTRSGC